MKELLSILVVVGGGLGTFLLGMKHLSEGLQAVSGSGLRRFMSLATTHRLAGVGTGIVSTVIVQSSSIITVMVVGFVSSGLLNLTQAINVIIGSNIGTTVTAWLAALNGSSAARQTALAHTLFNVCGTILIIPFFVPVLLPAVTSFFPHYMDSVMENGVASYPHIAAPIAAVHTLFNVITTVLFLVIIPSVGRQNNHLNNFFYKS